MSEERIDTIEHYNLLRTGILALAEQIIRHEKKLVHVKGEWRLIDINHKKIARETTLTGLIEILGTQRSEVRKFHYDSRANEWVASIRGPGAVEIRSKDLEAVRSFLDQLDIGQ